MYRQLGVLGAIGVLLLQGLAWGAELVAVLTEVRIGHGEVGVKRAGEADWTMPGLLLALRPGDQLRVIGDGQAVLVFTGGRGAQTVSAANSPYTVQAPTGETGAKRLRTVVASVTQFLLGQPKELSYQSLSVRSIAQSPTLLSPRETRLLPGPVTFEWAGPAELRYHIRVVGPQGLLWEQANLPRQPLGYPATAPSLRAGVRYTWELEAPGHPLQRARFELLPAGEAARVQAALSLLPPSSLAGYPRTTVLLMRAGLLFQEGLYHEARRELQADIAAEPHEPTLHLLLGNIYDRIGLRKLAVEAYDEAQFLSTRKP